MIPAGSLPENDNFFVLPPTCADIGRLVSCIREDGIHQYILIESTQSWANQVEELMDRSEVGVTPLRVSVAGRNPTVNGRTPTFTWAV